MAKDSEYFRNSPLLWSFGNLIFWKNTARILMSELGKLHFSLSVFECMAKSRRPVGPAHGTWEQIQSFRKIALMVLKAYRILRQATGGTSEQEHTLPDFHGIMIPPSLP